MTKVYYLAFSPINNICNENFFDGSITIYPNGEKGNIYYTSNFISDTNNELFLKEYKKFIVDKTKKIAKLYNDDVEFLLFNDKKKITKLCEDIQNIKIIKGNKQETIELLNDKFRIRKEINDILPTVDSKIVQGKYLKEYLNFTNEHFVVQMKDGSGGDGTYLVRFGNIDDIEINKDVFYSVSKYIRNIPINSTLVIGKKDFLELPSSVQLIEIFNNQFHYSGADFSYINCFTNKILKKLKKFNLKIAEFLKEKGYKGVIGIDYLIVNEDIFFMEFNPRFQSSSFLLSLELENQCNSCLGELHYIAITNQNFKNISLNDINLSFLNSNAKNIFPNENRKIKNGYFKKNPNSVYRLIYNRSIFDQKYHEFF
ncbi:ATP-grasp domain-containing protein [Staphylococcus kloosii]|uniref:ATP-grasp domain-containing protein n=1 Tax=Staphylococcus kloosii TaxID=29384 RepID=UPI0028A3248A|nr:ATP-grasp domain-containing protein [Staphylococcus kloosii]MDT3959810.1 ATP-grasp domain-containing protein [Staphylococcus kloosii]